MVASLNVLILINESLMDLSQLERNLYVGLIGRNAGTQDDAGFLKTH
jgi:hypothetical protein